MATAQHPGLPDNAPPLPARPPAPPGTVDLRVTRRLLWVGRAAYPLQNIARVHTSTLQPRRKQAVIRFLRNVALTLAVAFGLTIVGGATSLSSEGAATGIITFVWLGTLAALILYVVQLLSVLAATPLHVLSVETSGPSHALVTSPDPHHLDQLVGRISHAIENPGAEFQVTVESIMVNPRSYYFGDNVNMYGGTGNVGMAS
ncbi:DUF6232 family protein [Streptomyces caatingaensis]|uniref:Uncharacterized protein n=1 Tax=Streptomyces caatingaensis TaxID=1678637 RepID=A0A0K9XEC0_9ACTN|nr:DUF6232 family protein [Streptomyces caatingaensis]KNB51764.1 hypothetical protein AC230_15695 [Streptomyces caatingaensis]